MTSPSSDVRGSLSLPVVGNPWNERGSRLDVSVVEPLNPKSEGGPWSKALEFLGLWTERLLTVVAKEVLRG